MKFWRWTLFFFELAELYLWRIERCIREKEDDNPEHLWIGRHAKTEYLQFYGHGINYLENSKNTALKLKHGSEISKSDKVQYSALNYS